MSDLFDEASRESAASQWLYQHAGNVFGPIPANVLLDRVKRGDLPSSIRVAVDGTDDFLPLLEHPLIKDAAQKAAKSFERASAAKKQQAAEKRKRLLTVVGGAALMVGLAVGGYFGYVAYQTHRIEQEHQQALKKREEELRRLADAKEDAERAARLTDPEVDLDLLPLVSVKPTKKITKKHAKGSKQAAAEVDDGPQGCQLDQGSMVSTWRSGSKNMIACVKAEMGRAGKPAAVTLDFTIGNDGKVVAFDVDDRNVRGTAYFNCLKSAVLGLKFATFSGERCNVSWPFAPK